MRRALLLVPFCLIAACDDPGFTGVSGVRAVGESQVASCRFLSTITMEPGVYGPVLAEQGLRYARNKVLDQARQDGATDVVFDKVEPGSDVYLVRARAYRC